MSFQVIKYFIFTDVCVWVYSVFDWALLVMKAGLFAGFSEELQTLSIELFEEFWDDFVSIVDI